jgi:hypothetical protein
MADQQTEVGSATNAAEQAPAGDRASNRASIIAELEAAEKKPEPQAVAAKPAPVEQADDDVDESADADAHVDDDADDGDPDLGKDPETAKRMASVKKAEERSRAELARDRAEFERDRDQHKAKLDRFDHLAARAKYAAAEVLEALGLNEDDFEAAAKDLYARSKQFAADPKNKDAAARLQREREERDRLAKNEREVSELKAQLEREKIEARADREIAAFMGTVEKSISEDASPLVAKQIAKNHARALSALYAVANEIAQRTGAMPSPKAVVAAYEKQRRADLEEAGIDMSQYVKAKPNNLSAEKKKTAPTLDTQDQRTPPRSASKSQRDTRSEVVAALEAGNLDG